jgi:hypothetical protein
MVDALHRTQACSQALKAWRRQAASLVEVRAERVRETGMWLVSADVTGARDVSRIGYGPTSVMNPNADVVAQVPIMTVGMVVAEIGPRPISN